MINPRCPGATAAFPTDHEPILARPGLSALVRGEPAAAAPFMPAGAAPDVLPPRPFLFKTAVELVPLPDGRGRHRPTVRGALFRHILGASISGSTPSTPAGRHGVVFRSLDASRLAVVLGARGAFGLPYRFSAMRGYERAHLGSRELGWTTRSRWPGSGVRSRIAVRVGPVLHDFRGGIYETASADEHVAAFLTARWGLHTEWSATRCSSRTSTRRGHCGRPRCCCWMINCWRGRLPRSGGKAAGPRVLRRGCPNDVRVAATEYRCAAPSVIDTTTPPHPSGMWRRRRQPGKPSSTVPASAAETVIVHDVLDSGVVLEPIH